MSVPSSVLEAYGFDEGDVRPLAGGLINETYLVEVGGAPRAVVQKLHPVFEPEVNADIDVVTTRLAKKGLETPRLLLTRDGRRWVDRWRALTYVDGVTVDRVESLEQARSAARLIGQFHAAVDDWDYRFEFSRVGVHDTPAHLARLESRRLAGTGPSESLELADAILEAATGLPPMPPMPERICHGDLKISNIRFSHHKEALCLLDLDTLGRLTLAYELGDAMRSWCNRAGEDEAPRFDSAVFEAALEGYRETMPRSVSTEELASIPLGTVTVCLELAARFCTDVFDDSYFGWDATRYRSRPAHNHARAESMLRLAKAVDSRRSHLVSTIQTAGL